MLGIPLRLSGEYAIAHPSVVLKAAVHAPLAMVAAVLSLAFAVAALVVWITPGKEEAYSLPLEYELLFWALALLVWIVLRVGVAWVYSVIRKRFFLSFTFYLIEGVERDVATVLWGMAILVVMPSILPDDVDAQLEERVVFFALALIFVFLAHAVKYALERVYLEHIHFELFGAELENHVKDEEIICKLTTCRPERSSRWITPKTPPHTHDLTKTMRALLGSVIDSEDHIIPVREKRNAATARAADIMENLDENDDGFFTLTDLEAVYKDNDEAIRAMSTFASSRRVNLATLEVTYDHAVAVILDVFNRRENTYRMLRDRGQISTVVHRFSGVIFWIVVFVALLIMTGVDVFTLIIPLSSAFLGWSFIVGSTLQDAVRAFIFVTVIRAWGVGDRITFANGSYPTLIVDAIELFHTTAHAPDGRLFLLSNAQMFSQSGIISYKRSKDFAINASIQIPASTPPAAIAEIERRVLSFFQEKESSIPWNWSDNFMVYVDKVENSNKMHLHVLIGLIGVSWQYPVRFLVPQTKLYLKIQEILGEMGVVYEQVELPVRVEHVKQA